ncbi:MAG: hypothetical protein QN175_03285 [Armatimonadota bacterium]|nr:hypothetical protein [Armatimonadota bacterium]MDR7474017.1 hypothetical protein [Armatimonadota bacterium]
MPPARVCLAVFLMVAPATGQQCSLPGLRTVIAGVGMDGRITGAAAR